MSGEGRRAAVVLVSASLLLAACSSSSPPGSNSKIYGPHASSLYLQAPGSWPAQVATTSTIDNATASQPCDPIGDSEPAMGNGSCMLPFPDDYFTTPDSSLPTGLHLNLPVAAMPTDIGGTPIDPAAWSTSDGFSPGSQILAYVPGLDASRSGLADANHVGNSLASNSPVVILDTRTGRESPYFATLDANQKDPSRRLLIITPAVDLSEGDTYVVALRDMKDSAGKLIPAPPAFRQLLTNKPASPSQSRRVSAVHSVTTVLRQAGIETSNLFLAWDFTVGTASSITGPELHMRDVALADLGARGPELTGGHAPSFTVTSVTNPRPAQNRFVARYVSGTFDVPSFLSEPGGPPGSLLNIGPDGLPSQIPGNVQVADFLCEIPRTSASSPARPALYGHGLFGTDAEVKALGQTATSGNFLFCGTDWIGMSGLGDVANVYKILSDISKFPEIPDRLDQAFVDFDYLGRLLTRADGFASSAAFQSASGKPLFDVNDPLTYYGNSLGAVVGGAMVAQSPDIHKAVLGVPGMNFSFLIPRSADFAPFLPIITKAYPNEDDQMIIEGLIQILWDRGETDGYVEDLGSRHLPGTPPKEVLMEAAFGDHQVSNFSAEIEARTIGAHAYRPVFRPGRSPEVTPLWGIPSLPSFPFAGSAIYLWDNGTPAPPAADLPNTGGSDPHDTVPRKVPSAQKLLTSFLLKGTVINVCEGKPCTAPANPKTPE